MTILFPIDILTTSTTTVTKATRTATLPSPTSSESLYKMINIESGAVASGILDLQQMIQEKEWYNSDDEGNTWRMETNSESDHDSGYDLTEVW